MHCCVQYFTRVASRKGHEESHAPTTLRKKKAEKSKKPVESEFLDEAIGLLPQMFCQESRWPSFLFFRHPRPSASAKGGQDGTDSGSKSSNLD